MTLNARLRAWLFGIAYRVAAEPVMAPAPDELLARERELIDTARSAFLHNDAAAQAKAAQFYRGFSRSLLGPAVDAAVSGC